MEFANTSSSLAEKEQLWCRPIIERSVVSSTRASHLGRAIAAGAAAMALVVLAGSVPAVGAQKKGTAHKAMSGSLSPIRVGGQGALSNLPGLSTGFRARIATVNAEGGIDGRKIEFIGVLNDVSKTETPQSAAQKLSSSWHVTVDAPFATTECTSTTGQILKKFKILFIGWGVCTAFNNNRFGVGITGDAASSNQVPTEGLSQIQAAAINHRSAKNKHKGSVTIAIVGSRDGSDIQHVKDNAVAAVSVGMKVIYAKSPMESTGAGLRTVARSLVAKSPTVIYAVGTYGNDMAMISYLHALRFTGLIVDQTTYRPGVLTSEAATRLTGALVQSTLLIGPDNKKFSKRITKALSDVKARTTTSLGVVIGFFSADLLVKLIESTAKRVGIRHVSSKSMHTTLARGWTYTGWLGTLRFPTAFSRPSGCSTLLRHNDQLYSIVAGYSCNQTFANAKH